MNLLCPNCQKTLTVQEQFAGQLMKCPLCGGTFTVPSLPPAGEPITATPEGAEVPADPNAPLALADETPPPLPSASPEPAFAPEPAEPAFATAPPVATPPSTTAPKAAPASTAAPVNGYTRVIHFAPSAALLQWVLAASVVLIFFLQFFAWVGVYPGGVPAVTQNAWGIAFGLYTPDDDMTEQFEIITVQQAADEREKLKSKDVPPPISNEPGPNAWTILYLVFFLIAIAFTLFVVIQPRVSGRFHPQLESLLPYKWPILAGLNLFLLLLIALQLFNFSLESKFYEWAEKQPDVVKKKEEKASTKQNKEYRAILGRHLMQVRRTTAFQLVVLLHLLATASALLIYWIERRGPSKPLPALELRW